MFPLPPSQERKQLSFMLPTYRTAFGGCCCLNQSRRQSPWEEHLTSSLTYRGFAEQSRSLNCLKPITQKGLWREASSVPLALWFHNKGSCEVPKLQEK